MSSRKTSAELPIEDGAIALDDPYRGVGGSYLRDPITGALTPMDAPPVAPTESES